MTLPAAGGYEREAIVGTGDRVQPQHVGVHPLHVADSFAERRLRASRSA
jgi:hypothetical protein